MISINGKTYTGNNLTIINGKVFIDGQEQGTGDSKEINIVVNGTIQTLKVDACNKVTVAGDVGTVSTVSGDVDVGGNVGGNVSTVSGDVDCVHVGGSVSTISGDIKNRPNKAGFGGSGG